jgi:midasin
VGWQERSLVDGAGSKPAYNLRTLCRALEYARLALPVYGLQRALYDGCSMAFYTLLHPSAAPVMERLLRAHLLGTTNLKVLSLPVTRHAYIS